MTNTADTKLTMRQLAEMISGMPDDESPDGDVRRGLLKWLAKRFWDAARDAGHVDESAQINLAPETIVGIILAASHEEDERGATALDQLAEAIFWTRLPAGGEPVSCTRGHSSNEDVPARWTQGVGEDGEACCVDCLPGEVSSFIAAATFSDTDAASQLGETIAGRLTLRGKVDPKGAWRVPVTGIEHRVEPGEQSVTFTGLDVGKGPSTTVCFYLSSEGKGVTTGRFEGLGDVRKVKFSPRALDGSRIPVDFEIDLNGKITPDPAERLFTNGCQLAARRKRLGLGEHIVCEAIESNAAYLAAEQAEQVRHEGSVKELLWHVENGHHDNVAATSPAARFIAAYKALLDAEEHARAEARMPAIPPGVGYDEERDFDPVEGAPPKHVCTGYRVTVYTQATETEPKVTVATIDEKGMLSWERHTIEVSRRASACHFALDLATVIAGEHARREVVRLEAEHEDALRAAGQARVEFEDANRSMRARQHEADEAAQREKRAREALEAARAKVASHG